MCQPQLYLVLTSIEKFKKGSKGNIMIFLFNQCKKLGKNLILHLVAQTIFIFSFLLFFHNFLFAKIGLGHMIFIVRQYKSVNC